MFQKIKVVLSPEPRVLLCRHGHTALNQSENGSVDKIRGWADIPLNDEGREDADKSRKTLLKEGIKPNKIYASNLGRTIETAQILNKSFKLPIIQTVNLRPWDLGELTGKESKLVMPIMDMYMKHPDNIVPDGESFNSFKKRYITFLEQIITEAKTKKLTILLVTHFRNVKMAQAWIAAGMKDDLSVDEDVMNVNDISPGEVCELPLNIKKV
jgi:broad specificity phosphatase PhoE